MKTKKTTSLQTLIEANPDCAARHFGAWAIKPDWIQEQLAKVRAGALTPGKVADDGRLKPTYVDGNIAVIPISDSITKGRSSFGGTSSVEVRRAIREAESFGAEAIVLHIDSPGGTVAGTADLADDVLSSSVPVFAYGEDLMASAAYWVASQADEVWANRTAVVGSIGTYTVLYDYSKAQDQAGVNAVLVSTGGVKGLGADDRVTPELVADVQREINDLNQHFLDSVASGRGLNDSQLAAVSDGRVWVGQDAVQNGLVDRVGTFDELIDHIKQKVSKMNKEQFRAYAQANPDADEVKEIFTSGYAKGRKEGEAAGRESMRAEFADVLKTQPESSHGLVAKLFADGKSAESIGVAVVMAENEKLKAELAEARKARATQPVGTDAVQAAVVTDPEPKAESKPLPSGRGSIRPKYPN